MIDHIDPLKRGGVEPNMGAGDTIDGLDIGDLGPGNVFKATLG
jgi:hypothetical protein